MEKTFEIERRTIVIEELRAAGDGDEPKLGGYAAVFNRLSEDLGGFREQIAPGAFTKTLQESDIRALWNHDDNYPLGRMSAGTLKLEEDNTGLGFEIALPDTQYARDLIVSIQRGDVSQMSFGFRTIRDNWEQVADDVVRTLIEVQLFDVSPVTFPAYPQTSAQVRSRLEEFKNSETGGAPGQEPHPPEAEAEQAQARLTIKRKRLEIAEFEAGLRKEKKS